MTGFLEGVRMNLDNLRVFDILEGEVCVGGSLHSPTRKVKNKMFMITHLTGHTIHLVRLDKHQRYTFSVSKLRMGELPLTKNVAKFMELRQKSLEGERK